MVIKRRSDAERGAETLAAFVKRVRRDKGLSLSDVERRSGNEISNGYISRIENGFARNITREKLQALAVGLGVSEEMLFAVARGAAGIELGFRSSRFFQLYELYRQLEKPVHMRMVDEAINDLIETVEVFPKKKADGHNLSRPSNPSAS